jgi:hypothetical protein
MASKRGGLGLMKSPALARALRKKPNNRPQTRLTSPNRRQPGPNAVDRLRPSFVLAHSLANCYLKAGER